MKIKEIPIKIKLGKYKYVSFPKIACIRNDIPSTNKMPLQSVKGEINVNWIKGDKNSMPNPINKVPRKYFCLNIKPSL
jgi:hypothetical protein